MDRRLKKLEIGGTPMKANHETKNGDSPPWWAPQDIIFGEWAPSATIVACAKV